MKRLAIFGALIALSASALANPHYNYQHSNRGLRPVEAIVLGGLGAVVVNEVYRANQPRVIVQPVPVYPQPVYTTDPCAQMQYYNGQLNPAAAQAYCYGQRARNQEIEAYQRGLLGQ